jgi:hypothetical protein
VDDQVHTETALTGGPVAHEPGESYVEEWNSAVFGPGFTGDGEFASRFGDTLALNVPLFADAGLDRAGLSEVESGSTVLYRDGVKVGETTQPGVGQFAVPAEPAGYRLEVQASRDDVSRLSTRISCVWTFTSARPPDARKPGGAGLPLLAVRFAPPGLDLHNTVRADSIRIPITVQQPYNAPATTLAALTVDASFDDGRTWRPLAVTLDQPTTTAAITHPRSARYVSLRAHATDSAGNTVTQTVIRAYRS